MEKNLIKFLVIAFVAIVVLAIFYVQELIVSKKRKAKLTKAEEILEEQKANIAELEKLFSYKEKLFDLEAIRGLIGHLSLPSPKRVEMFTNLTNSQSDKLKEFLLNLQAILFERFILLLPIEPRVDNIHSSLDQIINFDPKYLRKLIDEIDYDENKRVVPHVEKIWKATLAEAHNLQIIEILFNKVKGTYFFYYKGDNNASWMTPLKHRVMDIVNNMIEIQVPQIKKSDDLAEKFELTLKLFDGISNKFHSPHVVAEKLKIVRSALLEVIRAFERRINLKSSNSEIAGMYKKLCDLRQLHYPQEVLSEKA